jgi:hypothetical protein
LRVECALRWSTFQVTKHLHPDVQESVEKIFFYLLESGGFGGGFGLGGEASALDALEVEALAEE